MILILTHYISFCDNLPLNDSTNMSGKILSNPEINITVLSYPFERQINYSLNKGSTQ